MSDNILDLFKGLNAAQAKELRRRIVPALQQVRREIEQDSSAKKKATPAKTHAASDGLQTRSTKPMEDTPQTQTTQESTPGLSASEKVSKGLSTSLQAGQEREANPSQEGNTQQPQPQQPEPMQMDVPPELQVQVAFVNDQIDEAFAEVGMKVTQDDPEWKILEAAWNDPNGSLTRTTVAAHKAAAAKKSRLEDRSNGTKHKLSPAEKISRGLHPDRK